jgi:hypothetical protein
MGLGWGVAEVLLIGFGTLAETIGVSRVLDIAATCRCWRPGSLSLCRNTPVETEAG